MYKDDNLLSYNLIQSEDEDYIMRILENDNESLFKF